MNAAEVIAGETNRIVNTYARPEVVFSHGRGAYLYDSQGKRYLDFAAGIAVNALGHCDPEWVQAVQEQADRLTHVSNLYHTAPHVELAERLVANSFADRVFFCNSGSEANETALKFARKYAWKRRPGADEAANARTEYLAFSRSFHGRTMGALSTTFKAKYREPFGPLVPGVSFVPFNDLDAARAAINENTCAVIVEPIQGEGGVHPADPEFLQGLRDSCDESGALLIFDEVQCGLGRSGSLWAHQGYDVMPDIMTLAKPQAGGLPIGAALVTEAVAETIEVGDHGSTFAAGPLVCRAAQVVFDRVSEPGFLRAVKDNGAYLMALLAALPAEKVLSVRGAGLLIGVKLGGPVAPFVAAARENGLLVISAGEDVLRLCPPLIVTRDQIEAAVAILSDCLDVVAGTE
jgi:predicted acetylornithine/succinylornithine family transaminase